METVIERVLHMNLNFNGLKYFIAAAKYGNFTKAAEHLFVTQPTLSRQIADLEKELGTQLFIRENKRVQLTEAGKICLKDSERIIKLVDNMADKIQSLEKDKKLKLNIGYLMPIQAIISSQILEFNQRFPHIDLNMKGCAYDEMIRMFEDDELDAVFTATQTAPDINGAKKIKISRNSVMLLLCEKSPLADRESVSIKELVDEKFIMLEDKLSPIPMKCILNEIEKFGVKIKVERYVDDIFTMFLLINSGKGVAFVSADALLSFRAMPGIRAVEIEEAENIDVSLSLVYNSENKNPALSAFLEEMKNQFIL